jgi:hypothetical protein
MEVSDTPDDDSIRHRRYPFAVSGRSAAAGAGTRDARHRSRHGDECIKGREDIAEMIDIATGNHHVRSAGKQCADGFHCLFCEEVNLINGYEIVCVLQGVGDAIDGERWNAQPGVGHKFTVTVAGVTRWLHCQYTQSGSMRLGHSTHQLGGLAGKHRPADHFKVGVGSGVVHCGVATNGRNSTGYSGTNTPAIAPVIQHANAPATMARGAIFAKSARRLGAIALSPPI